jgi:hypothetical protein
VPEIASTEPNIPIDNNFMDDELDFGMPRCWDDDNDEGDEIDECDAIYSTSGQHQAATELARFDLGRSNLDCCEGDDGAYADAE